MEWTYGYCRLTLEHLKSVVLPVAHQYVPVGHDCHSLQTLELRVSRPPAPERPQEAAVRVEDLYPVVARVADDDVPLVVHSYSPENKRLSVETASFIHIC